MAATMRVQSIVEGRIAEVPPQYIQPRENRPSTQHDADNTPTVPSINLFGFDDRHATSVREAIGNACREWGAFHVTNHGVPPHLLHQIRSAGLSFFNDCSLQDKLRYSCDPNSPASEGYGSRMLASSTDGGDTTLVLDWRDYFDHHTLPLSRRDPSRWPHSPPNNYREVVAEYSDHMKVLAQRLLAFISESLGLPSSCIEDAVGGDFYQNITISYYPPCPQPDLTLGLQSHSDMGAITLLIQDDVAGLQVLKDSQWITVHPPPHDPILILLADQTEIITNGSYRSSIHRVLTNSDRERLSVATFHDPAKTVKICPASQLLSKASPPRYRSVVYGDYVSSWYGNGPEGKRNIDALLIK